MPDASDQPALQLVESERAPIIYFETSPVLGHVNGVFRIAIAARLNASGPGDAIKEVDVVVAHLRGNAQALLNLRNSIDRALLSGSPTEGSAN